jgi:hypothetical protein
MSVEEIAAVMAARPLKPIRPFGGHGVIGKVVGESITIYPPSEGRNSYLPIFRGNLSPNPQNPRETRVAGSFAVSRAVTVAEWGFRAVLLAFLCFAIWLVSAGRTDSTAVSVVLIATPVIMTAFLFGLGLFGRLTGDDDRLAVLEFIKEDLSATREE